MAKIGFTKLSLKRKNEVKTITINNKSYAKMMFLLGMNHNNANKNLKSLEDLISHQLLSFNCYNRYFSIIVTINNRLCNA